MKFMKLYSYLMTIILAMSIIPVQNVQSVDSVGEIHGRVTGDCVASVTITIIGIAPATGTYFAITDAIGQYNSSCKLQCPGKYLVSASKPGSDCKFSDPVEVDLSKCCDSGSTGVANFTSTKIPNKGYGSITGRIYGDDSDIGGVTILITALAPNEGSWIFTTGYRGDYKTSDLDNCILPCPGTYIVSASKPGTTNTYSAPVKIDLTVCCQSQYTADFICTSSVKQFGFISGTVTGDVKDRVTITITGGNEKTETWVEKTDSKGNYRSSMSRISCVLPCPGKYTVTASLPGNGQYEFSDPVIIDMVNCCGVDGYEYKADFVSKKSEPKVPTYGRIQGKVSGPLTKVRIKITTIPASAYSKEVLTDLSGFYDTGCTLPCPGKYLVSVSLSGLIYTVSDPVSVELTSCCVKEEIGVADFTTYKDISKAGRIKGQVTGACVSGVDIIIEGISPSNGTWRLKTDSTGAYTTSSETEDCIIPCPGKYRVTAKKLPAGGCQFNGPFIVDLTSCCNTTDDLEVNFTSTSKGAIKGTIAGSCKAGILVCVRTVGVNKLLASVRTDANGNYTLVDSYGNCTLPCPGEYEVSVQAPLELKYICEFSEPVKVSLSSCCGDGFVGIANFTSKSIKNDKGRIAGTVVGVVTNGVTITIEGISPTQWTKTMTTNYYGRYETGLNTECSVPCPGKYKVTASMPGNDQYEFSAPVIVDLSTCCGTKEIQANFTSKNKQKGEISGVVTGACVSGVTIKIQGLFPITQSWILTTDSQGKYSTTNENGCILPCPGKYEVSATKPDGDCTFSKPVLVDLKTCCGTGKGIANFTATKIPPRYGRIYGAVTGDCIKDVTITITAVSPTIGTWTVKTDSYGKYYSSASNACVLPCPGKYTVTASKPGTEYIFSDPITVDMKTCCGEGLYTKADFTSKIKYGVISGTVSGSIKAGVIITIQGISPIVYTWITTTDATGKYTSSVLNSCKLPCPGKYTVTASYPSGGHTFSSPVTIEMVNCCGTATSNYQADFTSTAIPKPPKLGVITGSVLGSVRANVTITITGVSPTIGTWVVSTDSTGKYTSSVSNSCTLPCPGKYKVTASYPAGGHTFSAPVSVNMVICCGTTNSGYQANFTSTTIPKKYGLISGVVSGAIKYDVLITITGISPTTGSWSFKTDSTGKYASSALNSCKLPCPGKYTVTASYLKGGYTFSSPVTIDMVNCCGSANSNYLANFTSQVKKLYGVSYQNSPRSINILYPI